MDTGYGGIQEPLPAAAALLAAPAPSPPAAAADPAAPESERVRWRLFRYLSGGGLSACGSSSARDQAIRRQGRFLVFAGFLGVLWIIFWIV